MAPGKPGKIFIENRIYLSIEDSETWEEVLGTIDRELQPFASRLRAPITRDDLVRLTEIKIKRISKFDAFKADQHIRQLEEDIEQTQKNLNQLTKFTIRWFEALRKNTAPPIRGNGNFLLRLRKPRAGGCRQ